MLVRMMEYRQPVAAYLEDKVLDGQLDEQGKAHFTLGVQGPDRV